MSTCRHCDAPLDHVIVDLGHTPLANSYLREDQLDQPEVHYPLKVMLCEKCMLAQLSYTASPDEIFRDYDYFSSTSPSWVEDARVKCDHLVTKLGLTTGSRVIEVGSNDGYLLRFFKEKGIEVLGIDPAENCAAEAIAQGIPTWCEFFGQDIAFKLIAEDLQADVITGTNVLAHVPDINSFVGGLRTALKPGGVVVMEFPHMLNLLRGNQFDTCYHEHFFYFTLLSLARVYRAHGMTVFDVEELPTHGGSLRVYARRSEDRLGRPQSGSQWGVLAAECKAGLRAPSGYDGFSAKVHEVKTGLLQLVAAILREGGSIAAYGAPAKGNTLLNVCGLDRSVIDFVVDDSKHKQGKFTPGSHIPIVPRSHLLEKKPDYVIILPWNLKEPIVRNNPEVKAWGGQWITPIPVPTIS